MPNEQDLTIVVRLQDLASTGLAEMSTKIKAATESVGGALSGVSSKLTSMGDTMQSVGSRMSSVGQSLSIGLSLPIIALGKNIVETSMKFEASMELIRTQAGASQQEVENMTKSVLALAKSGETGQGPQKLADGLYHLESLGLRGAEAMDTLKISAQGADLGLADMEGVTNALGAAMVTGIEGTKTATEAMGLLDAIIGQGNMRMNDMVAALGTGVLPAAKNFGLSLRDVGAALATLTDNGMRADESATRLRMTFALMAAPTGKAQKALAEVGLSSYQLAEDMRSGGIVGAIDDLKAHLEASGKSATEQAAILSEAFGGGRSSAAILTLIQQSDRLKTKFDAIGVSAGTFKEKIDATRETNLFKMNAALTSMQSTLIDIGGTVMPIFAAALEKIAKAIAVFSQWWDTLSPGMRSFIVNVSIAVAVLGPLLVIFGALATAIGSILSLLGILAGIFTVTVGAMLISGAVIAGIIVGIVFAVKQFIAIADLLTNHWSEVWAGLKIMFAEGVNYLIGAAEAWGNGWVKAANVVIKALDSIKVSIPDWVPGIGGKSFSVNIPTVPEMKLPRFEMGGYVNAPRGTEVAAILHGGEQVIPAERVGGAGNTVNITINNPVVRSQSDLDAIKDQIDQYMRPLMMNAKLKYS
jgi:TP901 family phage tail tape measure protein